MTKPLESFATLGQKTVLTDCEAAFKKSNEAGEHPASAEAFRAFRAGWYARKDASAVSETRALDISKLDRFSYYSSSFHFHEKGSWVAFADLKALLNAAPQAPAVTGKAPSGLQATEQPAGVAPPSAIGDKPLEMRLYCPNCKAQHVDAPQPEKGWTNPPHRSHECQSCGCVWRPADVPTTGVETIKTKGTRDWI